MSVSTKQQRIAELARKHEALYTLHQHMDVGWLAEAFTRLKRDSATGIDDQTVAEYESRLGLRLPELLNRIKSGRYFAPPVKRVYIPKDATEQRPIGIPTTEDKIVQRAGAMLIEPIYETEFYDWSFGFRPGRSAHQAVEYLWKNLMDINGGWVLDVDIRKFFDSIDHGQLRAVLDRRVRDGVVRKLIDKWLKAGVLEEGKLSFPATGTPQGGVISPLLANIFLHDVLDRWFAKDVKPRLKGRAFMVRYADDFVMGFELKEDADRVMVVLPKRLAKYGLEMHAEKSRLVPFNKPTEGKGRDRDSTQTFDFLGFTHYWGLSQKGKWAVMRKTSAKRFRRGLKRIVEWCQKNRHAKVAEQYQQLGVKLKGHFAYYGITGNRFHLERFRSKVISWWAWSLARRDRNGGRRYRETRKWLCEHFRLPPARVVHSYVS